MKKMNGPRQGTSTASKTTDGSRVSPLGDDTAIKNDKGDQPSGGATTWTNTDVLLQINKCCCTTLLSMAMSGHALVWTRNRSAEYSNSKLNVHNIQVLDSIG